MNKRKWFFTIIIFATIWYLWTNGFHIPFLHKYYHAPRPVQKTIKEKKLKQIGDADIIGLATYSIEGMVLSKCDYRNKNSDSDSVYSPVDLALGWGPMSDFDFIKKIDIQQEKRFAYYSLYDKSDNYKMSLIQPHFCNIHIIPANKKILKFIMKLAYYDFIKMKGYLVKVTTKNGNYMWQSSLNRLDSGHGACEVMYVKSIKRFNPNKKRRKKR